MMPLHNAGAALEQRYASLVQRAPRQVALACGIKKIGPHSLRRSYATHLIGAGVSLQDVQHILGHHSILTTNRHTHTCSRTTPAANMPTGVVMALGSNMAIGINPSSP